MRERSVRVGQPVVDDPGQPGGRGARRRHGHLLAEQRPDQGLGAVHGAGHTEPGSGRTDPASAGSSVEHGVDADRVGIRVEQPAAPVDRGREVREVLQPQGRLTRAAAIRPGMVR